MITIGLLGGVASGKSLVAEMLTDLGAGLLDADRAGHALLDDPHVIRLLVERWGPEVCGGTGHIDRPAIAARVFGDDDRARAERAFLEGVLHPRIRVRLEAERRDYRQQQKPAAVLDAPLLWEAGWGPICDLLLFVDAPRELRLERARQRGWAADELDRREAAQATTDEKRQQAHVVLDNCGDQAALRAAVQVFWEHHVVPRENSKT